MNSSCEMNLGEIAAGDIHLLLGRRFFIKRYFLT